MKLSIAIPVYNEAHSLPILLEELRSVLKTLSCDYEILFVNDGSNDETLEILTREARGDSHIKILDFTRNFGHQAAVTAALDFATGDAVAIMDADLQDPPALLPEMIRLYEQGYEVVSPQRRSRAGESLFKRLTASVFYRLMHFLTERKVQRDVGDFRLLSRAAVVALRQFREQHRFIRGLIGWLGMREALVPFDRPARRAGRSKYSMWAMLRLSWTAVTAFSAFPLRLTMLAGVASSGLAMLYFFYASYQYLRNAIVPGWTSIVFVQCFFFGVTLVAIGLIGQYVSRIYEESKGRPLYLLRGSLNVASLPPLADEAMMAPPSRFPG